MFVNPISNFNVTNAFKFQALRDNEEGKPVPAEPTEPQPEEAPKLKPQLMQDTVSFGKNDGNGKKNLAKAAAAVAIVASPMAGCTDYESYHELNSSTTVNLSDYHKCGCDSIPIVIPGGRDTIIVEKPGKNDTTYIEKHDTIWLTPDTVYIPKNPHFEINDSINKDADDFDVPSEGDGDFVWAMQGRNEYLGTQHLLIFNGFFSNEHKSSFIDHAFEEDDIPEGGNQPSKYYYTRYDISSDYSNGRRLVQMFVPSGSRHQLPDDKNRGEAGWDYVGKFYVKNASVAETAKLIANDMDGTLKAQFTKNEKRGPGNIYKEWSIDDGSMPKTTIERVKVYRKDLDNLD